MVNLSSDQIHELMCNTGNIRQMTIIGPTVSQVKAVLNRDHIIVPDSVPKDGDIQDETILDLSLPMYYELSEKDAEAIQGNRGQNFLVNAINLAAAHRPTVLDPDMYKIVDGALIVLDTLSGLDHATKYKMRQLLNERVKPLLFFDNMFAFLGSLTDAFTTSIEKEDTYTTCIEKEDAYTTLNISVKIANKATLIYAGNGFDVEIDPGRGHVAFGDSSFGWGFTLTHFAEIYAVKFGIHPMKIAKRLWGDNFFSEQQKKWNETGGDGYRRGFCVFVLDSIYLIFDACINCDQSAVQGFLGKMNITLSSEETEKDLIQQLQIILSKWLPLANNLLEMIVLHLPSPITAQQYKTEILYEGPRDDAIATGMRNCDMNAPLMMCVSKMVPSRGGAFFTFGRVFSGKLANGMTPRIMGPNYEPGKTDDVYEKFIPGAQLIMGQLPRPLHGVPCGNVCIVAGVDQFLVRTGAITTLEQAYNLKQRKLSSQAVVKVAVDPIGSENLLTLIESIKWLAKLHLAQFDTSESGENIISCVDNDHLETSVKVLESSMGDIPIRVSDPRFEYRETVRGESSRVCLAKSPNKHNRFFMTAVNMPDSLAEDIDQGDFKARARILEQRYDFAEGGKIWCFGPEGTGPNILCDLTEGCQHGDEIRDSVVAGFQLATKKGVLLEENMRGICFKIHDFTLHSDAIHRGGGQIIPASKRCFYSSFLTADPALLEPVYLATIECDEKYFGSIRSALKKTRGEPAHQESVNRNMYRFKAYLPVNESVGFLAEVKPMTLSLHLEFDHWSLMEGDPLDSLSLPGSIIHDVRERKDLSEFVPSLDNFLDKMK